MSIYVDRAQRHGGVGRALYDRLEALLTKMGIVNLYAYIVYPRVEDEYANYNSFNFHVHMGYEPVGVFEDVANKFGRWYGLALVRKVVGPHDPNPAPVVPFPEL